mmetsp:Transcript_1148/g.3774  ORF Transcript_1148/g.3774 Transcript_1148/m.3774 type:complete len:325 (-) Transcript_1148:561-1535(-)
MPRSASAETIALDTNSRCASVRVSSSMSNELKAIIEFRGVRSSCEMFATNARCNCETLSASIFAFCSVRAANWEYLETSRASVNSRSSSLIKPSAELMSQKLENTSIVLYVIFATMSAAVIRRNCVTVLITLHSRNSWITGNNVHVPYVALSSIFSVCASSGCWTLSITCWNRDWKPNIITTNSEQEIPMDTTLTSYRSANNPNAPARSIRLLTSDTTHTSQLVLMSSSRAVLALSSRLNVLTNGINRDGLTTVSSPSSTRVSLFESSIKMFFGRRVIMESTAIFEIINVLVTGHTARTRTALYSSWPSRSLLTRGTNSKKSRV